MKAYHKLLLIGLGALIFRLILLAFVEHPGVGDPNHYYNLGRLLAQGKGYTIDYIWEYNNPPDNLVHAEDYWMPLTASSRRSRWRLLGQSLRRPCCPMC